MWTRPLPRWTRCWWRGSGPTPGAGRRTGLSGRCTTSRTTPWPGSTPMSSETRMRVRLFPLRLALVMVAAGCSDFAAPSTPVVPPPLAQTVATTTTAIPMLRQAPTAPRLQTYQMSFWDQDANPDMNGDGVVNGADQLIEQNLAVYSKSGGSSWGKLLSKNDPTQQVVGAEVLHFSQYAVSW